MNSSSNNSSSTEWETDSEPQSPLPSKPTTPIPRVDTLRPNLLPTSHPQRRPQRPNRASRPSSSLSTKSTASSVHPLLGLHPHAATTSMSTISTSPIKISSLSHQKPDSPFHDDPPPSPALFRPRTTSTLSSPSSTAISSLAHIPTRPPSPYAPFPSHLPHLPYSTYAAYSAYASATPTPTNTSTLVSFFPPSNPLLSLESIHPLLPSPFLGNHLTLLTKRAPLRESLDRVRTAKARSDASAGPNGR